MPKTKFGKWSVWCLGLFVVFFIGAQVIVASGQEGGETFFDNLFVSIPMSLVALSAIFAFAFGLFSIVKQKERSLLVYLATLVGLWILTFVVGEFIGPDH